jgi:YqjK-like protein
MKKSLVELHRQRGRLIERIAHQRATLAREVAPVKAACDATDWALATARDTIRYATGLVQRHPAATAGLAATLIALKPLRAMRLLGRILLVWRSWRTLREWLPRGVTK